MQIAPFSFFGRVQTGQADFLFHAGRARQSHLSDSGLLMPFERSRNSRPPCAHAFPASSLRSEAAEPPSLDEAFNMQSPWRVESPTIPTGARVLAMAPREP